jgi:hypothetical protein
MMRFRIAGLTISLLALAGCGSAYTVSDGIYIMETRVAERTPAVNRIREEVRLQIGKDGSIIFSDESGRRTHMHGKLDGNEVQLTYRFEGLFIEGTGRVTNHNRMEGACTLEFLDVGLDKNRVFAKDASWSLVKKE